MELLDRIAERESRSDHFAELYLRTWNRPVLVSHAADAPVCRVECDPPELKQVWQWLIGDLEFAFATLVVEESPNDAWLLIYVFYREDTPWVHVEVQLSSPPSAMPSVVGLLH